MTEEAESQVDAQRTSLFSRALKSSVLRYLFAGGLSFLVDFGLLALLHEVFRWPTWIATATSFTVSFAFTYSIQRFFAFGGTAPHGVALAKYTVLVVVNLIATTVIVTLLGHSNLTWAGGKVIATVITTIWNYFIYKYWVFSHSIHPRESGGA